MNIKDAFPKAETTDVRALGSFENLFDLYTQELPVQFSVVAEVNRVLTAKEVETALRRVQESQPLLTVGVRRTNARASFYRSAPPIPLVVAPSGTPWDAIATTEQTWALDVTKAPLARCTLSTSFNSSVMVMTFAHQIADGLSAVAVLKDLVRAINGESLPSREFPPSQEEVLASAAHRAKLPNTSMIDSQHDRQTPDSGAIDAGRSALNRRGTIRPFDSARPHIRSVVWSPELTRQAIEVAHHKSTTLHGLVTAAAVRVLLAESTQESVALMNPMDLRGPAGMDDTLALYFASTRMGFTPETTRNIWALARSIRQHITIAHTLPVLAEMSAGMAAATSSVSTVEDATHAMVSFANYDLMVTNLGDLSYQEPSATAAEALGESSPATGATKARILDLFGPTMATQIDGEQILGLSTFNGRLRSVITSRTPLQNFLERIHDEVSEAIQQE